MSGTNSRMSETDCAHLLVRAKYLDEWQERRKEIVTKYNSAFNKAKKIIPLIRDKEIAHHACQKYVININDRDDVLEGISQDGIECKVHYPKPLHEIELYDKYSGLDMLSKATVLSRRVLSLPLYPELTDAEVKYVIKRVLFHTSV
jgi:dTDP-4-amino-4,6-dideoxygalactose transaminase